MQQQSRFNPQSFWLGVAAGACFLALIQLASCSNGPTATAPARVEVVPARDCAARTVYHQSTADDWGQRALIAHAVLNASAPGGSAPIPCAFPSPLAAGGTPDPYLWQSALDAVDAVASGSYSLPSGCAGITKVVSIAVTRSACEVGGLAFVEVR